MDALMLFEARDRNRLTCRTILKMKRLGLPSAVCALSA